MSEEKDYLVILPRPQISVSKVLPDTVQIVVTGVSDDNQRVELNEVAFPVECAREVGEALLKIASGE